MALKGPDTAWSDTAAGRGRAASARAMLHRAVGPWSLPRLGFGEWALSDNGRPSEADAIALLHAAFDEGVRFVDTSDAYCLDESEFHHGELLVRAAIESYPAAEELAAELVVATKGGCTRVGGGWARDVSASHLSQTIADSHQALWRGKRPIQLWQLHWTQPLGDEAMAAILAPVAEAVAAGTILHVGLSNCNVADIEAAAAALPHGCLVSVQNKYGLNERSAAY